MPHGGYHGPPPPTGSSGSSSDARDAYIAGSSGSTTYTPPEPGSGDGTNAGSAFEAGVSSTQNNVPGVLQDTVTTDSSGNFVREINPLREQLENLETQDDAFDFINNVNQANAFLNDNTGGMGILDPNLLGYIKDPLVGLGAFTTDPNEQRNVYQLLINKMFQGDDDQMRGALPITLSNLDPEVVNRLRRIGPTNFVDPALSQGFFGDVKSLFTGNNEAAVNLSDFPGGGIAELPNFGQAGLDFTKEQGFRNYGKIIEDLITAATPLKYGKMLAGKTMGGIGDLYNSLYPNSKNNKDDLFSITEEKELDKLIDSIPVADNSLLYQDLIAGSNPVTELMTQNPKLSYNEINDLVGGLSGGASSGTPDFGYF